MKAIILWHIFILWLHAFLNYFYWIFAVKDKVISSLIFSFILFDVHTNNIVIFYISVQFSHSVMSDSLQPHELQHTRPPCPSPTPGVHSNSSLSSRWCHPAISSYVVPFFSCPQSLPAEVFSNESIICVRWPKYWSFSFSIIPSKEIPGLISLRMDWLDLLAVQGTRKSLLQHHSSKASFFGAQLSSQSNSHICTLPLEKP